jgi:hypothetical protein
MTQRDRILWALERGRSITPMDALRSFGCFRLGARIYELKRLGYQIETRTITKDRAHFAEYRLAAVHNNEGLIR